MNKFATSIMTFYPLFVVAAWSFGYITTDTLFICISIFASTLYAIRTKKQNNKDDKDKD